MVINNNQIMKISMKMMVINNGEMRNQWRNGAMAIINGV
jgi:hypothetical protein